MNRPAVHLDRRDAAGEPGALVATRLMGEFLDVPSVTVALAREETFTLEVESDVVEMVRDRIQGLLTEPRFASWRLRPV